MESISLRQYFDRESCSYTYFIFDPISKECIIIDPVLEQIERDLESIKKMNINYEKKIITKYLKKKYIIDKKYPIIDNKLI